MTAASPIRGTTCKLTRVSQYGKSGCYLSINTRFCGLGFLVKLAACGSRKLLLKMKAIPNVKTVPIHCSDQLNIVDTSPPYWDLTPKIKLSDHLALQQLSI
jgi:hypothetical protein